MSRTKELSRTVTQIRPSGIRKIFEIACNNPEGIDLSIGDPDFDIPSDIKEEGIRWIEKGFNRYVSTKGIPELRAALSTHLKARNISHEDLLITAGATGAYALAIMTLVSPGDEVLIADPYFVSYTNVVIMYGGVPKLVRTYPDFSLREEEIVPLITPRTKAIVLNNPNNPTGVVYSTDELQMVCDVAELSGLHIISDEIYDRFCFSNPEFVSVGNLTTNAIVISGFSKSAGMTGWRLGYVSGSQTVIDAMATFQQYSYVCANSIAQKAAVKAITFDMDRQVAIYRKRRDLVYEGLQERFNIVEPQGAFYAFPEAPKRDAETFVAKAIERGVFVIPGDVFSRDNSHFRVSFAVNEEKLQKGIEILNQLA